MADTATEANKNTKEVLKNSDDVADWLRRGIRVGRFVPGQRLIEADLIRETSCSRSKVREALHKLATQGLVEIEEFRGARVTKLGIEEVRQIYKARMAVEGMVAGEFAANGSKEDKDELLRLQNEMNKIEKSGNHDEFARLNAAWHRIIITGANNPYAERFLSTLTVPIYRILFATFYNSQRIDSANEDHKKITKAILESDAILAEQQMREHIEQGFKALTEINSIFMGDR